MAYEYDIFISYRTQFPFGDWVNEHLYPFLQSNLDNNLGRSSKIFLDKKGISVGDAWPERLKYALAHSRCLVGIWCPSYFTSKPCLAELAIMLHREKKLGYRTATNPSGLVIPMTVHDGENFPPYAKAIHYADFRRFARVGFGFTRTERYIEFQDELDKWAQGVAGCVTKSPPWKSEWSKKEWIDDPASFLSPLSPSGFFPSLG